MKACFHLAEVGVIRKVGHKLDGNWSRGNCNVSTFFRNQLSWVMVEYSLCYSKMSVRRNADEREQADPQAKEIAPGFVFLSLCPL